MLLTNWLRPFFSSWIPGRKAVRAGPRDAAHRIRSPRVVERLEPRLCLSAAATYSTANADWFGIVGSAFSATGGFSGSSAGSNTFGNASTRQFLVRLTPEATAQAGSLSGVQSLIADASLDLTVTSGLGLPGQVVVSTTERDSVHVVRSLQTNAALAYFEEDFAVGATETRFPNELTESSLFTRQYGLNNTGQTGGTSDADIDAPEAWDVTIGSVETVISLIDSGVDFSHPDIYLNIWINQGELPPQFIDPDAATTLNDADADRLITFRDLNDATNASFVTDLNSNGYIDAADLLDDPRWADGIDTDDNGFEDDLVGWDFFENDNRPFDEHGHGTHVAGILGATGDNGLGVSGVNWQTSIMPLRFLNENNQGDISDAVEAINYSTMIRTRDENAANVRVSNNSWGSSGSFSQSLFDAVAGNFEADILFVAAAGNGDILGQGVNNDDTPFFPASLDLPNVISVAALDDRGELAEFTNFGRTSVDVAAPGVNIISLEPGDSFIARSGTSMATPHVAGTAALVFDAFPDATALEARDAILTGATVNASLNDQVNGNRSLNAFGAVTATTFAPVPELVTIADITVAGTTEVEITVTYTDDGSVDTSTFDIRDIEVRREGFSETLLTPVESTTTTVNGRDAARYRFTAPGGTWDATENGIWLVSLREGEIQDDLGLYSAPRELGQFNVSIDDANVFFVNTTLDTVDASSMDGKPADSEDRVSLRAAIMHANSVSAGTTIVVPDGIYTLTIPGKSEDAAATGDLDLTSSQNITLIGGGAFSTIIDGQQLDRVFDISSATTATVRGFTVRNGNTETGGGIENSGTLTIESTIVSANTAETAGGGVYSDGLLTVIDSSLEENQTSSRFFGIGGGGLAVVGAPGNTAGQTSLQNTSIVNNTSTAGGGGVFAIDAELALTNVTISGNTAQRGNGGGLFLQSTSDSKTSSLSSVTFTQNNALIGNGGGLATDTATAQIALTNSIVADNLARISPEVEGFITSDGTNLFGQPSETNPTWRMLVDDVADFDQIGTSQSPLVSELELLQRGSGVVLTRSPIPDGPAANTEIAGRAESVLTARLPIVYSTAELEPNDSRGEAMRLDERGWSLEPNADISNAEAVPHVTITATGDGTFDFYSFTVDQAGSAAVFDIDNGALTAGQDFDTQLFLFDSSGTLLASNDNSATDSGSGSGRDSRIDHQFPEQGYYTVAVGAFSSETNGPGELTGAAPPIGTKYVLNISLENHALAEAAYEPTPTSVLIPVTGTANGNDYVFSASEGTELFNGARTFATGDGPSSVAIGDVSGDGIDDVVTTNLYSDSLTIQTGKGDGTFQQPQQLPAGDSPSSVSIDDVNGDGIDDIIYAQPFSSSVGVLISNGDGTFRAAQSFSAGSGPRALSVGDVSGDGFDDIVTVNQYSADISVLRGRGDGTFETPLNFSVESSPTSVALADVNGDGFLDVVSANSDGNNVSVLVGNGDGTLQTAVLYPAGDGPKHLAVKDVDGDGLNDIVTANAVGNNVSVLSGNGDGTFQLQRTLAVGDGPSFVSIEDISGDGINDIVTANAGADYSSLGDVTVLRGNGDGTFQAPLRLMVGDRPVALAVGDVTGDGVRDIVTANAGGDNISVLKGDGRGSFQTSPRTFAVGDGPSSVFVGDITGDGIDDIVTANAGTYGSGGDVSVLKGNANGTFQTAQHFAAGDGPRSVSVVDLNGDGIEEIITANYDSNNVSVLPGNGDGTFQAAQSFSVGDRPQFVSVDDVDGDGFDDIVTANSGSNNVTVLLGNGDGTFQTAQNFAAGVRPTSLSVGDVSGDGIDDIVSANAGITFGPSGDVSVLEGNGDGTFQTPRSFAAGDRPYSVELSDIGGDGIDDIVVASAGTFDDSISAVSVLRGNGDGTFQTAQRVATGNDLRSVSVGDVSGDGIDDIVTADRGSDSVNVLKGNGDGTFQLPQSFAVGDAPTFVSVRDVSGDGIDDIVTANSDGDNVSVLIGNGPRLFSTATPFGAIESVPLRGHPILFGEAFGETYWITSNSQTGELTLWSLSANAGVRVRAQFFTDLLADEPQELFESGSRLVIQSQAGIREFDPATGELTNIRVADGTFTSAQTFAAEDRPASLFVGDVSGDGIDDIITANSGSDNVSVLRGNGDGTFQARQNFVVGSSPSSLFVGDVSGDGIDDIIATISGDSVSVLKGNGNGVFQSPQTFAAGGSAFSLTVSEVTGDGIDDIIAANSSSENVSVLNGNGDGTFQAPRNFPTGGSAFSVSVGDVDNDGIADIVTANLQSDTVSVLRGNGDGTFQTPQDFDAIGGPFAVTLNDINGDGVTDIVTANEYSNEVSVLLGDGDGTFQAATNYLTGNSPNSVSVTDVSGDGFPDIVTANRGSDNVSVLKGNGDGTFQPAQNLDAGDSPQSVFVADVDDDGIEDIISANANSDDVSVLSGRSSVINVLAFADTTVFGNSIALQVRESGATDFQALGVNEVGSAFGALRRRDYDFVQLDTFEDKLLALVRLKNTTSRLGEVQLLLIDTPEFEDGTGDALPVDAENLTLSSSFRVSASDDDVLFVSGDRIYLTAEIAGAGIGSELLTFDRQNGLRLVADLLPGSAGSDVRDFIAVGDDVYFTALSSRVDNNTQQPVLRRELFLLEPATGTVRAVRAGQEVTGGPSLIGSTLFFNSQLDSGSPNVLLSYDATQDGVPSIGAFDPVTGNVTGAVFLDRNSDGRRNVGEPGRAGVTLFVDVNDNGRREESEPSAVTRLDDPATTKDETGQYEFFGLPAGEVRIREVAQAGFDQTFPLQVLPTAPELTLLDSATPDGGNPGLGLPSVVGGNVVFVDQTNAPNSQLVVNGEAVELTIPDEAVAIQSIGTAHAQDGSSIVFTATLTDGRELVLERDSRGDISVVVDTGQAIISQPIGGVPSSTDLTDIEDGRNGGFDSLSVSDGSIGFLAQADGSVAQYYLGGVSGGRFAEFVNGQTILDGDNEILVDRVVEGTGLILSGADLFLDKATLDTRVGGNTGWRITTRSGDEILPLTFYDRIYDVSISGLSAAFRASDVTGEESIFLAQVGNGVTRLSGLTTPIPDGSGTISVIGSASGEPVLPSVAFDGQKTVFIGGGDKPAGVRPGSVSLRDLTGDGVLDMVIGNDFDVSVLIGNGDGTLQTAVNYGVINLSARAVFAFGPSRSIALDDINGDGFDDIVTASRFTNSVSVLAGNGDGSFQTAANFAVGIGLSSVSVGDVTGDGIPDIVTPNEFSSSVSVLVGNGDGSFQTALNLATGSTPVSVSLGDVTGDGILDIAIANQDSNSVSVLAANGDGTFPTVQNFSVGSFPVSVSLGDVNGDGVLDVVTANLTDNSVSVLTGNGDGTFQTEQNFVVGSSPVSVSLGDVNSDGVLDAVTANTTGNDVSVLTGNGDGTFQTVRNFAVGSSPVSVSLGDLTGDGVLDIVTANFNSDNVSVLTGNGDGGYRLFPSQLGLYAQIGEEDALRKIVDRTDFQNQTDFPGQVLTDLAISHDAISGDSIVFRATFSGGAEAIYRARLESEPVASVNVIAGQTVSDVLFGSIAQSGTIRGVSFTDADLDGVFNAGDSVNEGRTVFLDENLNGVFDSETEISDVTDANGEFVFSDLVSERTYVFRESLPNGKAATFPRTLTEATIRLAAAGSVEFNIGSVDASALGESADGIVRGVIFNDVDGNGVQDSVASEPGIGGLRVFVDKNDDGILNGGERSSVTAPDGSYTINQLRGDTHSVRVELPAGTQQTNAPGNRFTTTQRLSTSDGAIDTALIDLDGDGDLDLATTLINVALVQLFFNDGDGNFVGDERDRIELDTEASFVSPLRLAGAGEPSALVSGFRFDPRVGITTRQPDGSFATDLLVDFDDFASGGVLESVGTTSFAWRDVATGDFNGDGFEDLAIVADVAPAPQRSTVAIFDGSASGAFTHRQTIFLSESSGSVTSVAAGRLTSDGTVQLVAGGTLSSGQGAVTVLNNTSSTAASSFAARAPIATGGRGVSSVTVGDLDGDGFSEIVGTHVLSGSVFVIDQPEGTFGTARTFATGVGPTDTSLSDVDQDGDLDVLFTQTGTVFGANADLRRFGILRNEGDQNGDGAADFQPADTSGVAVLPDGSIGNSLVIGQLNDDDGDGVVDDRDVPDVVVSVSLGPGFQLTSIPAANTVNVRLNSIVPGALRVDLPTGNRIASGLNFGLRDTLTLTFDAASVSENGGASTGTVTRSSSDTSSALVVDLLNSNAGDLTVPARVTIDEGASFATFSVTGRDNSVVDGASVVGISASASGLAGAEADITVTDDDVSTLSLTVSPGSLSENGGSVTGTVSRNTADVSSELVVSLLSANPGEATVLSSVTIAEGETSQEFTISGVNEEIADGTQSVPITAAATDFVAGSVSVDVTDDDVATLIVSIADASVLESNGKSTVTVSRNTADVSTDLLVTLTSSKVDELSVPATVRIPAGQSSLAFEAVGVDEAISDGTQTVVVTAAATGFVSGSDSVDVIGDTTGNEVGVALPSAGGRFEVLRDGDDLLVRIEGGAELFRAVAETVSLLTVTGSSSADTVTVLNAGTAVTTPLNLKGSGGADRLDAGAAAGRVTVDGGAGNDVLVEGLNVDVLNGGDGTDTLIITVRANEDLTLGDGQLQNGTTNTVLSVELAVINGDSGDNFIVAVDFNGATTVLAGSGDDTVLGSKGPDSIEGGDGLDQLQGFAGNDTALGQGGDDIILGGNGLDSLVGGAGNDLIEGQSDDDVVLGGLGADLLFGGDGNDHLESEEGADTFHGGNGNDTIFGGAENDELFGDAGDDELHGEGGDDLVDGGEGDDIVLGDSGADSLIGGAGEDVLDGGDGHDVVETGSNNTVNGVAVSVEVRTVITATGADTVAVLPANERYLDEWDEFFVEVWVAEPPGSSVGTVTVDVPFDAQRSQASENSIVFGSSFTSTSLVGVDNTNGRVRGLQGTLSGTATGNGQFNLLARIGFDPRSSFDLPNNQVARYILPQTDTAVSVANTAVTLNDASEADSVFRAPVVTNIWPVMYDLDDSGRIGFGDVARFAEAFGVSTATNNETFSRDFSRDGVVDFGDVALFAQNFGRSRTSVGRQSYATNFPNAWEPEALLAGIDASDSEASADTPSSPVTQQIVRELQDATVDRFQDAGLNPTELDNLRSVEIQVQDLPDGYLGLVADDAIIIDIDASGVGWFIDDTSRDDLEFAMLEQSGVAVASRASSRFDLLSVIAHELGHYAGWGHDDDGLMSERLNPGERRLPQSADTDDQFTAFSNLDELLGLS